MPSLSERVTIPSPPQVVWRLLADPGLLASCIPGAALAPTSLAGVYDGAMRINFGSIAPVFRGEARVSYDDHAMRCTLQARWVDAEGKSRATASAVIAAQGLETTALTVEGDVEITGPVEPIAAAQGGAVARALLAEFVQNLTRLTINEGTPAPDAEDIPIVEPETLARQVRAAAIPEQTRSGNEPGAVAPRPGLVSWLRHLVSRS